MLKLSRVCVPLGMECNLQCKYCYRDKEKLDIVPVFSDSMKSYLSHLSPDFCEAVIASGGEPLLCWDKVKELFSYVPQNVHKKLMTNGTLLTPDIVDYVNCYDIEVSVSHDGLMTSFLRGIDILSDDFIVSLLKQIKHLRVLAVITKYNVDIWENFFDTMQRLGRKDFFYDAYVMMDIPSQHDLIDGFDYDTWLSTRMEFLVSPYRKKLPWYDAKTLPYLRNCKRRLPISFNILPDGTVCDIVGINSNFGTVENSFDECYQNMLSQCYPLYCERVHCPYVDRCNYRPVCASEHTRKWRSMMIEAWTSQNIASVREYVNTHLTEIEHKYGYFRL